MPFKNPHKLYSTWQGMLGRCRNPKNPQYKDYGGRGISVCERWKTSFQNFVNDMGERPEGHSLDRKNNDLGYSPDNCRWATKKTQQRNQTVTRKVLIDGTLHIAADLSESYGIKTDTIIERASKGMCFDDVVSKTKHHNLSGLSLGGKANGARQKNKTHCKYGHEFTTENTLITKEGWRSCRKCHADRQYSRRFESQS